MPVAEQLLDAVRRPRRSEQQHYWPAEEHLGSAEPQVSGSDGPFARGDRAHQESRGVPRAPARSLRPLPPLPWSNPVRVSPSSLLSLTAASRSRRTATRTRAPAPSRPTSSSSTRTSSPSWAASPRTSSGTRPRSTSRSSSRSSGTSREFWLSAGAGAWTRCTERVCCWSRGRGARG